jgi:hypothetical protein
VGGGEEVGAVSELHSSRTSISGTALSGRKPINRRLSVRSDSFLRQNEEHIAG